MGNTKVGSNVVLTAAQRASGMAGDARFYLARRDTRWDVYPQREPEVVVARDWHGFWTKTPSGLWFKSPASYVYGREITPEEADAGPASTMSGGAS